MESEQVKLGTSLLTGLDSTAKAFLDSWLDRSDSIEAKTSGSTGEPKAIQLAKSAMLESARRTNRFFGIDKKSVLACPLSASYIAGKMMIVRALEAGCELMMLPPSNNPLAGVEDDCRITLLAIVPSQIDLLVADGKASNVENIIIGGGEISIKREKALTTLKAKCYATYGMTETCSHIALRDITSGHDHYEAFEGIRLATDSRGCLIINDLTTNDIVELIDDNKFRWKGRYDNVINSGGIKIHPESLEREIISAGFDRPFYLTGRKSEKWGTELVAIVSEEDSIESLRPFFEAVDSRMRPKDYIVEAFEYTSSGKLKRRQL